MFEARDDTGHGQADADAGRDSEERLYDEYVALAATGRAPPPAEFLAAAPDASEALREALEKLHRHAAQEDRNADVPWETLGGFRLIERIGSGGMGMVFLAEERALGRKVALKVLRPELAASAVAAERFRREARAVAQLRHPHIVTLFAAGEERGVRYLAMELVEGASLADMFSSGELARTPLAQRLRWIVQIARALHAAHESGVVHRDVKPSNIRIASCERALIVDFGLARTLDSADATLTDSFAGSPKYASPEQIARSRGVDARTDVYSLGVTLYQVASGRAPFEGESVEQLFHRILTADAAPLRKLAPQLPRDLETVTHKAMERDPRRRYASAAELADDLEAVLELRPIRGRPPGLLEQLRRAARRSPALAAGVVTGAVALTAVAGLWLAKARSDRAQAREQARREVELASETVAAYRAHRGSLDGLQRQVQKLRDAQRAEHLSNAEVALLDEHEERIQRLRREWTESYFHVLDKLALAERLDPKVAGADAVRAELHMERLREALAARDAADAEIHRERVRHYDREGRFTRELDAALLVDLITHPAGAAVYVFRCEELSRLRSGGDARFAPIAHPVDPRQPEPGAWCLRVTHDFGPARAEDLIVELDGRPIEGVVLALRAEGPVRPGDRLVEFDGEPVDDLWFAEARAPLSEPRFRADGKIARDRWVFERGGETYEVRAATATELGVEFGSPWEYAAAASRPAAHANAWRGGEQLEYELPAQAPVRPTTRPLFVPRAEPAARTPLQGFELPRGNYVLLALHDGFEALRVTIGERQVNARFDLELLPSGETPRGWARIPHAERDGAGPAWIAEHELVCSDYLEYLNDPQTLAEIARSSRGERIPREGGDNVRVHWTRGPDGRFAIPQDWRPDWPVVGISWLDAQAYVRWRNQRASETGEPFVYSLPTRQLIVDAGLGGFVWAYTYGDRFRAKFSRCCFARPNANIGPVLRFPVDESPFGVFDLTGGALEWAEGWYDEPRRQRHALGGGWGQANPDVLTLEGGLGAAEDVSSGETGLRLVRRRATRR